MSQILQHASNTKLLIDGQEVPGIQSIQFEDFYNTEDINSVSSLERIGAAPGQRVIQGQLDIRSRYAPLDELMAKSIKEFKHFQIVIEGGATGAGQPSSKITFDECYITRRRWVLDATKVLTTIYYFTSTRIVEETK